MDSQTICEFSKLLILFKIDDIMSSITPLYDWPEGFEAAVIIGIDDIHPESSTEGFDCGGNIEGGALDRIKLFMENYSKVPITLYVTPDWRYRPVITSERFGRFRSITTNFMNDPVNPLSYILRYSIICDLSNDTE